MLTSVPWIVKLRLSRVGRQQGFTLIELLVVIAIAAAMTGIVVTSMSNWLAGVERRADAAQLQLAVQHAVKMAALKAKSLEILASPSSEQAHSQNDESRGNGDDAIKLPVGWTVAAGARIVAEGGFCLGGSIDFKSIDSTATLLIERGSCEVRFQPQS